MDRDRPRTTKSPFNARVMSHANISPDGRGSETPYPDRSRLGSFVLLPRTVVAAGGSARACAQPQIPFKGRRLSVDPACAPFFSVVDIKVGKNSMLFNCEGDGAPAACFPPIATDGFSLENLTEIERMLLLNLETCNASEFLSVDVVNTSDQAQVFRGIIWGDAVDLSDMQRGR